MNQIQEQSLVDRLIEKFIVPRAGAIFCATVAFFVLAVSSHFFRNTPYNNYSLLADAFVHRRVWIEGGGVIDSVRYNGHDWIVNDPIPAILLVPFAMFQGTHTNQTTLGIWLCVFGIYYVYRTLTRIGLDTPACLWLTGFAFAGTDLLWAASTGDVWFLAQVSAFAFTAVILYELTGKKRPIIIGLLFSCATLSRFPIVFALPGILAYLSSTHPSPGTTSKFNFKPALAVLTWITPVAMLWCAYNEIRWGVPYDRGHTLFYHQDVISGQGFGSPFSLSNLPLQLWSFFGRGWNFIPTPPFIVPNYLGTALTWTSPALALTLFATRPRKLVLYLWIITILIAGPSFLYYVNGASQFGMRHALDFEPFLIILMALAWKQHPQIKTIMIPFIIFSMTTGLYGTWYWHNYVRP